MPDPPTFQDPPRLLGDDLLARLESTLRSLGVPWLDSMSPGLSNAQIDQAMAPLGLEAPLEARRWWHWHDGVEVDEEESHRARSIGPRFEFLPMWSALESHEWQEELARKSGTAERGLWRYEWLPIVSANGKPITCDCSADPTGLAPIRFVDHHGVAGDRDHVKEPDAPSFGEVVNLWLWAMDVGIYSYDRDDGWSYQWELLPSALRTTGLV